MGALEAGLDGDPFAIDPGATERDAWQRWRERKLADRPRGPDDLLVEVRDPAAPSAAERAAILERCRRWNMALYRVTGSGALAQADPSAAVRALAARLGLVRLDHNWLAGDGGISELRDAGETARRGEYIPYTNRPIRWHTDGYYNPPARTVRAMLLHCVAPAQSGGENTLIDHEIAYLLLRDQDPDHVRALSAPDAMRIPAREDDEGEVVRAEQVGPVFSRDPRDGALHMRYTARTRSIAWKRDPMLERARAALTALLEQDGAHRLRLRMEAGMGLVCNNVLHDRAGFTDSSSARRLVLRARFLERVAPA
ncbi:MAG: TauD/TfdA family dioxygenase [Burkholderiaceae bacterium]